MNWSDRVAVEKAADEWVKVMMTVLETCLDVKYVRDAQTLWAKFTAFTLERSVDARDPSRAALPHDVGELEFELHILVPLRDYEAPVFAQRLMLERLGVALKEKLAFFAEEHAALVRAVESTNAV